MSDKIEHARLLAQFVHFKQRRQDGEPYINHCERVAYQVSLSELATGDMIIAAWLHDTIEDGERGVENIISTYFSPRVFELVHILTHLFKKHTYNKYIGMVSEDPQALQIKWNDMIDNTSYSIPQTQFLKYREACMLLQQQGFDIPSILKERLRL